MAAKICQSAERNPEYTGNLNIYNHLAHSFPSCLISIIVVIASKKIDPQEHCLDRWQGLDNVKYQICGS